MSKINRQLYRFRLLSCLLVLGLTLSACSETTPAKPVEDTKTNEWDSLQWDQGTWG